MRTARILILGLFSCLAALFVGVGVAGATHGNATWDCFNNKPVLNVTIKGEFVTDNINKATFSSDLESKTVERDANGDMPDTTIRVPKDGKVTGTYLGPEVRDTSNVPYTVTGEEPNCAPAETTTTTGSTGTTTTTVPGQTEITTASTLPENTGTLPETGSCGWVKILATGLIAFIAGILAVVTVWYLRKTRP